MGNSPRDCGPGGQWLVFIFIWWGIVLMGSCPRTVHNLWQSLVFRGTPNNLMFWLFPENGSISERTVNRALIVYTTL